MEISDPNLSLEKALKGLLQAELEVEKWRLKVCVLQKLADSSLKNSQDKVGLPNQSEVIREETIFNSWNNKLEPNGVTENGSNARETDSKNDDENDDTNFKTPNANKSDKTIAFHSNESLNSNEIHKIKSEHPNEVHAVDPTCKNEIREDDSEKMDEVNEIDFKAGINTRGKSETRRKWRVLGLKVRVGVSTATPRRRSRLEPADFMQKETEAVSELDQLDLEGASKHQNTDKKKWRRGGVLVGDIGGRDSAF